MKLVDVYGYEDLPAVFNDMAYVPFNIHDVALRYEDDAIYVGSLFKNKEHFKITVGIYAIKELYLYGKGNVVSTCKTRCLPCPHTEKYW
ncbi:unnamed protein product [Thlaspi arvense]|uniref:Uncharacterized protein n=1 Tax=Thlaspi arvense TaxID=13288 RepID=A0AAU9SU48_THLAR|nr:unnamed protein product [Thlaspi arvense]